MPCLHAHRVTLPASHFVPICAITHGNYFSVMSLDAHDVVCRSDPDDAATEWTLSAFAQEIVNAPVIAGSRPRWLKNHILFWAKGALAETIVIVKML